MQLLTRVPISGTVLERHYDVVAGSNTWVQFDHPEGERWVGVFGNGDVAFYSTAVPFADDGGRTVLVVARGQGYIVDTVTGALRRKTRWNYSYSAVAIPGHGLILVADTTNIWVVGRDEDVDVSARDGFGGPADPHRIALDGLVFDEPGVEALTGQAWFPDGWYGFRIPYNTLVAEVGPLLTRDEVAYQAIPTRGGFPTSNEYYVWMQQFWL